MSPTFTHTAASAHRAEQQRRAAVRIRFAKLRRR
jgi:hypothetical protein